MSATLIRKLFNKKELSWFRPLAVPAGDRKRSGLNRIDHMDRNIVIGAEAGIQTRYRYKSINIVGVYEFPPARE
jgi:hypothetical protein